MPSVVIREATAADKEAVLALRTGLFAGLDYLAGTYDTYLAHPDAYPHVGLLDGKIILFGVVLIIDNGRCTFNMAARVKHGFSGQGFYRYYSDHLRDWSSKKGVTFVKVMMQGDYRLYISQDDVTKYHIRLISVKAMSAFLIQSDTDKNLEHLTDSSQSTKLQFVDKSLMNQYIASDQIKQYLFSKHLMIVNRVAYSVISENIECMYGMNTTFFSDLTISEDGVSGLVSSCSTHCGSTADSWIYRIDIWGSDVTSLHSHFTFHLNRYLSDRKEAKRYLIIITDQGNMAQQVLSLAKKFTLSTVEHYSALNYSTLQESLLPVSKM